MLSAGEVMLGCGVEQCLGVFDQRMIRIYRLLGSSPNLIAQKGQGKEFIGIGLWTLDAVQREQICQIAGLNRGNLHSGFLTNINPSSQNF
jgi:acyl homoserine lactone synthase